MDTRHPAPRRRDERRWRPYMEKITETIVRSQEKMC